MRGSSHIVHTLADTLLAGRQFWSAASQSVGYQITEMRERIAANAAP